jgi:hypothetical protein
MDCETASGLMPWLLNRTLEPSEAETLESHITGCAACRADLEETRRAAAVFAAHPSAKTIVDAAWDLEMPDAGVVRRHLESCAGCAEDYALARESRRAGEAPGALPAAAGAPSRVARWVALPATLAAGLLIGLWLPRAPAPPAPPAADPALARLQDENARLRESVSELRGQAEAARAPELNLPVFEVLPESLTRGPGGGAADAELAVPEGSRQVALLLVADVPAGTPAALEIRTAAGQRVWQAEGLVPNALGAYSLAVPASMLPEGAYRLVLQPRGSARVEYRVRVRRAPGR